MTKPLPSPKSKRPRGRTTQAVIMPNMAHDMMLEPGWQSVADRIVAWLNKKGIVRGGHDERRNFHPPG